MTRPGGYVNCITGGAPLRDPGAWNPPAPRTWEEASRNELAYVEAVRNGLIALRPARPPPYIIPAGRALVALKAIIEAGDVPGFARDSFFASLYEDEAHLNANGSYLVTLVFCTCMFKSNPQGLPYTGTTLTDDQAALFQRVALETVSSYALSGIRR